ncbi:MAG: hypothetical protein ACRCWO_11570 [Bosea sp. (in: a-proteobacteria)]
MIRGLIPFFDIAVAIAALTSAFFWVKASRLSFRRIDRGDVLDAADINRIVTSLNRSQILNGRAALATGVAAALAAIRFTLDLSGR